MSNFLIQRRTFLSTVVGAAFVGYQAAGAGAAYATVLDMLRKSAVTPAAFGAVGDGVADDTDALRKMFDSGASYFDLRNLNYKIILAQGQYLHKRTSGHLVIFGQGWQITDASTGYTKDGAFTQIIWGDATDSISITGGKYLGPTITNPAVNHGYIGASFLRVTSGAKNNHVDVEIENARHGIHSGDYVDVGLGGCRTFRGNLRCKMVGYPIATYLADDIELDIYAEKTHRTAYVAGCDHARITARFKDQYIAGVQVLLTDAKIGAGTSKGCSDVIVTATDVGSTIFVPNSYCAGISLSRIDQGTVFRDIKLNAFVVATDTVATTLGAVSVTSSAKVFEPSYPFNWEPGISIENLKIGGVVDRSSQTGDEHGVGEIYVQTRDTGAHFATIRGFDCYGFQYKPGSGEKPRGFWFIMPGLVSSGKVTNSDFGTTTPVEWETNAASLSVWSGVRAKSSNSSPVDTSRITMVGCEIIDAATQPMTNVTFINTTIGGAKADIKRKIVELTLAGNTVTWEGSLPSNAIILGVSGYVTQAITGASGYLCGIGTSTSKFVNTNAITLGSSFNLSNGSDTGPYYQKGTDSIVVTAKTANFTGGKIRLTVAYIDIGGPLN